MVSLQFEARVIVTSREVEKFLNEASARGKVAPSDCGEA